MNAQRNGEMYDIVSGIGQTRERRNGYVQITIVKNGKRKTKSKI